MTDRHLQRSTLKRVLEKRLSASEAEEVAQHLWECDRCRHLLARLAPDELGLLAEVPAVRDPVESQPGAYRSAFDRLRRRLAVTAPLVEREIETAPKLLSALLAQSPFERLQRVQNDPRFHSRALVDLLLERCRQSWIEQREEAETMADLALEVLDQLAARPDASAAINDLRARRWAYVGNIRRLESDLRGSEEAFVIAESFLEVGSGDPLARAEVLDLRATLLRDQRRFESASRLLGRVRVAYGRSGDSHLVGRVLLKQALVESDAGRPERGIRLLERAGQLIDTVREPRLQFILIDQQAILLHQLGRYEEALAMVPKARLAAQSFGNRFDRLRVQWLEARLLADLGRYVEAEDQLLRIRAAFAREGNGYDTALVSLDLASLYLRQGRSQETRDLASEMLPIFQSRDIHREALAALMVFKRAAEIETVSLGMVEGIAGYLKQARYSPSLRYERPS